MSTAPRARRDKDALTQAPASTPVQTQQMRVTFTFREIETRETFIEKRRADAKQARKRETQSRE
jgi:predicted RNA-binding protein with PIN domain